MLCTVLSCHIGHGMTCTNQKCNSHLQSMSHVTWINLNTFIFEALRIKTECVAVRFHVQLLHMHKSGQWTSRTRQLDFIHVLVSCLFYGASFCFVETILAPRLTFAFYLGRLFEKTETTKNYKHYTAGFQLPTSTLVFTVGACHVRFHDQFLIYILLVISPGWRRAMLVRNPRRGIIGPSERFYQVFAAPQHRHLFTGILSFLTDSSGAFTEDIVSFSLRSAFLRFWTSIFRRVDTPSVADALTPAASPAASSDHFPEDWTDAI